MLHPRGISHHSYNGGKGATTIWVDLSSFTLQYDMAPHSFGHDEELNKILLALTIASTRVLLNIHNFFLPKKGWTSTKHVVAEES